MEKVKRGDDVMLRGTVVHTHAGSGDYAVKLNGMEVEIYVPASTILMANGQPLEPTEAHVRATVNISGYSVGDVIERLESWDQLIRGLGYVEHRQIADDSQTVTFWCHFETDEGDDMHARDRAQETMNELQADTGVDWEYVEVEEVPR